MQSSDKQPYLIGIAGASGSGKTSVANIILKYVGRSNCLLFSMDSYYKELTETEKANVAEYNFDRPDALDLDLLSSHLTSLLQWKTIQMPIYSFALNKREDRTQAVIPNKIIIFEGILAFFDKRIRDRMDMKIFIDLDRDICLSRRIYRDIIERGRDLKTIIERYHKFVKPAFEMYIKATRRYADAILPKGADNSQAIDLLSYHLKWELNNRFRASVNNAPNDIVNDNGNGPKSNHARCKFNQGDIFDRSSQQGKVVLPQEKEHRCLEKILTGFLDTAKFPYYKIYMEIIINSLKTLLQKEMHSSILYCFSDTDEEINSKVEMSTSVVIVYEPILLVIDEKMRRIIHKLDENAQVKSIQLASVYLYEDIVLQLSALSSKINHISVYYGNGLKAHMDYLLNGGFIGSDLEGEYKTVDYLFTKKNFDDMMKVCVK